MFTKILAIALIVAVLTALFGKWVLLIPLGVLVLWLIRQAVDIFWWGRDKGRW